MTSNWLRPSMLVAALALSVSAWADVAVTLETCAACHGKDGASSTPELD